MTATNYQYLVERRNRENLRMANMEQKASPWFWVAIAVIFLLLTSNVLAADAKMMIDIIECESSGRHNVSGDDGVSYGIAQFRKDTFYEFARKAGMRKMRYRNPVHQLRVMNWALDNGYGNRWSCFRKLKLAMD